MSEQLVIHIGGHSSFDQLVIEHYVQQGINILLLSPSPQLSSKYSDIAQIQVEQFDSTECAENSFFNYLTNSGLLEADTAVSVIHGIGESEVNVLDDLATLQPITASFELVFRAYRLLYEVLREKGGNVVFPLMSDALSYQGDDISSINNHAKNAFMMSYSKEMNAFNVSVNCIVLPHLAANDDHRKKVKRSLRGSVFGMKPTVYTQQEFISYIDEFCQNNYMMTGQCINFRHGTGLEL